MKKNVIITGVSGFVGKHLVKYLDSSQFDFTFMTRNPDKLSGLSNEFSIVFGDLNDQDSLRKAFAGQDILINLAAEVRNQDLLEQTNVIGTTNLVEALKSSQIRKVIHLSSVGVVGKAFSLKPMVVTESELPTPQNKYEVTKLKSEQALLKGLGTDFELVILRPTNIFGEMHPFNALNNLFGYIQSGKKMIYTKQAQVNYVYVGDLCQAIIWFLKHEGHPGLFNVGNSMLLADFYKLIEEKLNVRGKKNRIPGFLLKLAELIGVRKLRAVSNAVVYDDSALKRKIGEYDFGTDKGLTLTINYFRKKGLLK